MWYIHTMEYHSELIGNEVQIHVTIWMNFKNISLSEWSQKQKTTCCMIPFIEIWPEQAKPQRPKVDYWLPRTVRQGEVWLLMDMAFLLGWGSKHILKLDCGDAVEVCNYTKIIELHPLNWWVYDMWIISLLSCEEKSNILDSFDKEVS